MASKKGERTKLSARARLGPGMFGLDARAAESIERAQKIVGQLPHRVAIDASAEWLELAIREAARNYWSDVNDDAVTTIGDVKEELAKFLRLCDQLTEGLEGLKPNTKRMLAFEILRSRGGYNGDVLEAARDALDEIKTAGARLMKPTYAREEAKAGLHLCSTLWTMRERAVGRKFSRTYDTNEDVIRDPAEIGFNHPDSMFVFELMKAIDPRISLEQVEYTLRKAAKLKDKAAIDKDEWVD